MTSAYTPTQISLYEEYISLPTHYQQKNQPPLTLPYLTALHIHQISRIPYENLILHYSPSHEVYLDPQKLFTKIVGNARGRGGYCMELSIFFNHVLRALGFQVYTAGVRVRPRVNGVPEGDYQGWFHIVNIVTLPSTNPSQTPTKYMIDVGFGGDGPTHPIPLISSQPSHNLGTQEIQLIHSTIPQQIDQSKKLWIYQYRNHPTQDWNSFYCFHEMEFVEADWEIINFYTNHHVGEGNWHTRTVMVVGFLRGRGGDGDGDEEEEEERIVGKRMLINGTLKENLGGKTRVVRECGTEGERLEVLREVFGITFTDEERCAVKGRSVELPMAVPLPN